MRVVFDTNVLVAAFAADGLCQKLLRRANKQEFTLLVCPVILDEFQGVLPKKLDATKEEIGSALALLHEVSVMTGDTPPAAKPARIVRDPDDDLILFCAVTADADFLVTGDKDLLTIGEHGKIKILDPRGFEMLFA
ncbi:MAG TPA: putative toxin-antitoxin system toxin component, PIN family [Candidatus Latescibacteria bacterium]|nr:putative toxin-antitoxin system toxin component, PIN family [Candidatus Latescibacterota bacterium]